MGDFYSADYARVSETIRGQRAQELELRFIEGKLREVGASSIIDAGCGAGRLALPLAERGFSVRALDRSADLLAIGRSRAAARQINIEFVQSDIGIDGLSGRADAIVCWNTVVGQVDDGSPFRLTEWLDRLVSPIQPGGRLILEQLNLFAVARHATQEGESRFRVTDDSNELICEDTVSFDASSQRLTTSRTLYPNESTSQLTMVLFSPLQIREGLVAAGARAVDLLAIDGRPLSLDSESLVVIADF